MRWLIIMMRNFIGVATAQVEGRKNRELADSLSRKKGEVAELRQMISQRTLEITQLQSGKAALEKRVIELEKTISGCEIASRRNLGVRSPLEIAASDLGA